MTQLQADPGQVCEHGIDVEVVADRGAGLAGGQPQVLPGVAEVELDLEAVPGAALTRCARSTVLTPTPAAPRAGRSGRVRASPSSVAPAGAWWPWSPLAWRVTCNTAIVTCCFNSLILIPGLARGEGSFSKGPIAMDFILAPAHPERQLALPPLRGVCLAAQRHLSPPPGCPRPASHPALTVQDAAARRDLTPTSADLPGTGGRPVAQH